MNELSQSLSPYLRQHADNPVHWREWGDEAFAEAARRNVPVFLSVGYATCHWCHVMARESFSDPAVAEILNAGFVSIKVDREMHPDVDDAYMAAVQLSSGRGGWPMTVFLAPDRRPFFAGTYFPPERRGQIPSFTDLLRQIGEAWSANRTEVEEACAQFDLALRESRAAELEPFTGDLTADMLHDCARELEDEFDPENGGFGHAPKFPPHTALEFLIAYAQRPDCMVDSSAHMVRYTLRQMILGGIHDLVGGGFHRYSTDAEWVLPHFEKMLTDNGQLLTVLAKAMAIADGEDRALMRLAGQGIIRWLRETMTDASGAFFSAQNADTLGREGLTYVWRAEEIADERLREAYGIIPMGNFLDEATRQRTGENILLWSSPESPLGEDDDWRFAAELAELARIRAERPQPSIDTKLLASANGLMIRGLADWARATGDAQASQMAGRALAAWDIPDLPHMIAEGEQWGHAYLDDVAYLALAAEACIGLVPEAAELSARWTAQLAEFPNLATTNARHENTFGPNVKPLDQAVPSPVGAALRARLRHGIPVAQDIRRFSGWMHRAPHASETLHLALHEMLTVGQEPVPLFVEVEPGVIELHLEAAEKVVAATAGSTALNVKGARVELPSDFVRPSSIQVRICGESECRPAVFLTIP